MSETHIVVCVFSDGNTRISAVTDIATALRQWKFRYGAFLPVAAFPMRPDVFCDALHIDHRLPVKVDTAWAAEHLHRAPVASSAQPDVFRHLRGLGGDAIPLFSEWRSAVLSVAN